MSNWEMKNQSEEFQDCFLIECIEFLNNMRPIMEQLLVLNKEEYFELDNIDIEVEQVYLENFAMKFFQAQHKRFKEKYDVKELNEYMEFKGRIYDAIKNP